MSLKSQTQKKVGQIHAQIIKTQKPQTLNPLLKSLSKRDPKNALVMYNHMLLHNLHTHYSFTYALNACTWHHHHHKALEIHGHVVKTGHSRDIFIHNTLLHFYATQNDIVSASKLFDAISCPNVVSWSLIVSGLSRCGFDEAAIVKFSSMDVDPNSFTLVSVVSACSGLKALNLGKAVHGYSLRNGVESNNVILGNALLDFYTKCGSLDNARQLFDKMPQRDVFSWTTLIGGYARRGLCEEAVDLFRAMIENGEAVPNEATLVNLLSACSSVGASNLGEWVYSYIARRTDILSDRGNVCNALINMFVKCGRLGEAVRVFRASENKDVVSWSTMISGMAMSGRGAEALQLFALMIVHGVRPDGVTFVGLLSACSHAGLVGRGLMFFGSMRSVYGIEPRPEHYTCVVDMYGRAGLLEAAEAFIREMPVEADCPAVQGALLNACKIHENREMFERIGRGIVGGGSGEESIGAFALLSNAYASSNRWDEADKIRGEMTQPGLKKPVGSSWIEADPQP